MKKFLFFISLVCGSQLAFAQFPAGGANPPQPTTTKGNGKITGIVLDSTNRQPVSFATVALDNPATGKPIDGTVCDENGKFVLKGVPAGSYKLSITFIGYKAIEKPLSVGDKEVNVGTLLLATQAKQLKELVVEGQRALIEEKVDRTIYNAENDQTTKGGDATDVLKRVPLLSVDLDGNVSLRGSQNIKVLINNKPSTIAANSIADALKQIPADEIKTVEVITSPSAKYDAEGSGGIINIITKKNNLQGASLNVDGGAGYRGANLGVRGSYRKGKMGFSLGGFGRSGYNVNGTFDNSQLTRDTLIDGSLVDRSLTTQHADTRSNNLFGRYTLGWDYDINKFNSLSASVQYGVRNNNTFQDKLLSQTTSYQDNSTSSSLRNVDVKDLSGTVDLNLNYTHTYEKPQREFSILALYSRNSRTNNFVNNILNESDFSTVSRLKNDNESSNQEITLQADYQTPIGKTQMLELGGKDIIRKAISNYAYFFADGTDGPYVPNTGGVFNNGFTYNQNITSGYLSYTLNFLKNYTIKAGSRYEYTTINADYRIDQKVSIPSYGVLVPSVNLSRKLKNGNMVKLAYNRRIQRPSLQFLNPNIQNSNPFNSLQGNPSLQPEYTNNYELSYNTFIKGSSLNFSTFMRNTRGSIQAVRTPIDSVIRTTYQNIGKEDSYGFSIFANVNIGKKISLNGGTDAYYAVLNNNIDNPIYTAKNEGWVVNGRIFGNYNFSKGWGLQLFSFYRGRQVQLQGTQGGFGIYSLSVRKEFNEKKGSIGFGAENFFTNGIKIPNEFNSPLLSQNSTNVLHNMNFKITFSYRIGKLTVDNGQRKRKKSIDNDDLKEGGGDNSQNAAAGGQQQQGAAPAGGGAPTGGAAPGGTPGQGQFPGQGGRPGQRQFPAGAPGQRRDSTQTPPAGQGQPQDSTRTFRQGQFPGQGQPSDSLRMIPDQGQPADSTRNLPQGQKPSFAPGQYPNQPKPQDKNKSDNQPQPLDKNLPKNE